MGRKRRIGVAAAAVLAGVALVGCSGSKQTDPVEIGSLPADVGAPIDLTGKVADTGALVDWPDACGLLTDEVVQSLLPQTESVVKTPESQTFEFHSVDDPLAAQGTKVEVPDSRCTVKFGLPLGMLELDSTKSDLLVVLDYAGSPSAFDLNFEYDESRAVPIENGRCMRDDLLPNAYSCANATGQVAFSVQLTMPHHGKSLKDPSRYVHDGETTEFSTSDDDAVRREYLDERITLPAIEAILTRLKG